jgi:hypothetical protein
VGADAPRTTHRSGSAQRRLAALFADTRPAAELAAEVAAEAEAALAAAADRGAAAEAEARALRCASCMPACMWADAAAPRAQIRALLPPSVAALMPPPPPPPPAPPGGAPDARAPNPLITYSPGPPKQARACTAVPLASFELFCFRCNI